MTAKTNTVYVAVVYYDDDANMGRRRCYLGAQREDSTTAAGDLAAALPSLAAKWPSVVLYGQVEVWTVMS